MRRRAASRGDGEDLAIFASQLAALGVPARVAAGSVPEKPGRNLQFDLAPRLADGGLRPGDGLALIAADRLDDAGLVRLRRLADGAEVSARAFGSFASRQTALGVRARLAYVFGREPELFDAASGRARRAPARAGLRRAAPRAGVPEGRRAAARLLLVGPDLNDPLQAAALAALALRRSVRTTVLTDSRTKEAWTSARGRDIPFFQYGEALPLALAERTDICVFFVGVGGSYRLQTLVANLLVVRRRAARRHRRPPAGAATTTPSSPAPPGLLGLDGFLDAEILPNLGQHRRARRGPAAPPPRRRPEPVLALPRRRAGTASAPPPRRPAAGRAAASSSCRRTASGSATPSAAR